MKNKSGISLILCVSVMMILSVMAITFSRIMTYEQEAANNYSATVDAKFTALAGIERAKAVMWQSIFETGHINSSVEYPHPVYNDNYSLEVATNSKANLSLKAGDIGAYSYSGLVGGVIPAYKDDAIKKSWRQGRYEVNGNFYALKIVMGQGKLNLHSHNIGTVAATASPARQRQANAMMNQILYLLAIACGIDNTQTGTDTLVDTRRVANSLRPVNDSVPREYTSIGEVWERIEAACQKTLPAATKANDVRYKFLNNLTIHSWMDPNTKASEKKTKSGKVTAPKPPMSEYAEYYPESRAPVEGNLASPELLRALIANVKASVYMYNYNTTTSSESMYKKDGSSPQLESETSLKPDLWRLTVDFSQSTYASTLTALVNDIITHMNSQTPKGFKHMGEFEKFIDDLPDARLPSPTNCQQLTYNVTGGGTGWATSGTYAAQWYQACKDALKANFNPNVSVNAWNPNQFVYRAVTKADLYSVSGTTVTPGYSVEFTFFSQGYVDITSLGRVTNRTGTKTIASALMHVQLRMCDVLTSTTQAQFAVNGTSTITYPEIANLADNVAPSVSFAGWVEPKTIRQNARNIDDPTDYFDAHLDSDKKAFSLFGSSSDFPNNIAKIGASNGKMKNYAKPTSLKLWNSAPNNVFPDGILSKQLMYLTDEYLKDQASQDKNAYYAPCYYTVNSIVGAPDHGNGVGELKERDPSSGNIYKASSGKGKGIVANYRGTVEFWVKLDVPGNAEVNCGLVAFTQMSTPQADTRVKRGADGKMVVEAYTFREGIQTYLFKTATGKLRFSRMYFGGYFDSSGAYYGCYNASKGDVNRKIPKREMLVDISDWKAHSWHHVIVSWDDTVSTASSSVSVYIDGTKKSGTPYWLGNIGLQEFCVLNERSPATTANIASSRDMDGIFIGGIYRNQQSSGLEGMTFRYAQEIHSVGNATVDGFRSYSRSNNNDISSSNLSLARFDSTPRYEGKITVPEAGVLGPMFWTAYPYAGQYGSGTGLNNAFVLCEGKVGSNITHIKPTLDTKPGYKGEGLPTNDASNNCRTIPVAKNAEFTYVVDFTTAVDNKGARAPVLDSVQIIVMRPQLGVIRQLVSD